MENLILNASQICVIDGFNSRTSLEVSELKSQISKFGYLPQFPVVVTAAGDGQYRLVDGHRRLEAVRQLEAENTKKTYAITANVIKGNEESLLLNQMLSNEGKPFSMYEFYIWGQKFMAASNSLQKDLAKKCGKSSMYVSNCFKIGQLPVPLIRAIEDNLISASLLIDGVVGYGKLTNEEMLDRFNYCMERNPKIERITKKDFSARPVILNEGANVGKGGHTLTEEEIAAANNEAARLRDEAILAAENARKLGEGADEGNFVPEHEARNILGGDQHKDSPKNEKAAEGEKPKQGSETPAPITAVSPLAVSMVQAVKNEVIRIESANLKKFPNADMWSALCFVEQVMLGKVTVQQAAKEFFTVEPQPEEI